MISKKRWYEATDLYDDEIWINYVFTFKPEVKYLSVHAPSRTVYLIEESQEEFEDNILDNYELNEIVVSKDIKRFIIQELI